MGISLHLPHNSPCIMSRSRFLDVLSFPGGSGSADRNSGMRAERNAGGMTRMQPATFFSSMDGDLARCVCDPAEVVLTRASFVSPEREAY